MWLCTIQIYKLESQVVLGDHLTIHHNPMLSAKQNMLIY